MLANVGDPTVGVSCPCELFIPCSDVCSCAFPFRSGGCSRCCKYGSAEQKLASAKRLAEKLPPPFDFESLKCIVCNHEFRDHYVVENKANWHHGDYFCQRCDCAAYN